MTTTVLRPATVRAPSTRPVATHVVHALAATAVVFLAWQAWTWGAWLLDGPEPITEFRDPDSTSWYAARVYEGVAIVMAVAVFVYVVRQCRTQGRLVFDAQLCIAGASIMWLDPFVNVVEPLFMYSSNWVNLETVAGGMPGAVNPDIGRLPWPFLFLGLVYTFGLLTFALLINAVMRAIRTRRPGISTPRLLAAALAIGLALDLAFEIPMYKMRLWAYPGSPDEFALFSGDSTKFPWVELVPAALLFTTLGALRFFKDDRGRTVTERGLDHLSARRRSVVSTLALVGLFNLLWLGATSLQAVVGFFADPYKPMPAHIVNDLCDAPGIEGTRYGECPGTPGFQAPIRSLPDPSPSG